MIHLSTPCVNTMSPRRARNLSFISTQLPSARWVISTGPKRTTTTLWYPADFCTWVQYRHVIGMPSSFESFSCKCVFVMCTSRYKHICQQSRWHVHARSPKFLAPSFETSCAYLVIFVFFPLRIVVKIMLTTCVIHNVITTLHGQISCGCHVVFQSVPNKSRRFLWKTKLPPPTCILWFCCLQRSLGLWWWCL